MVNSELQAAMQVALPIIEVSHVATRFGEAVVHEDVSLTIHRGEVSPLPEGTGVASPR